MDEERQRVSSGSGISGTCMGARMGKAKKLVGAARVFKAVTTLAIVVVPVAATVGAIVGYGAYSLVKQLKRRSSRVRRP
ncbi:MAG: hypothetical protein A4E60_03343 [Syntrophorhabdus sp. PtaB.Bin047]|nr:MAG: hypothetical protein A4E60_03343 [Syntrophorhabdus sp. PtaB.Bin047]